MRLLLIAIGLLGTAHAALGPDFGIENVGVDLQAGPGTFGDLFYGIAVGFVPLINIAGAVAITITSFFLTLTASENLYGMVKRVTVAVVFAIVLTNIGASIATSFANVTNAPDSAAGVIGAEFLGVITFLEFPAGILCLVSIIYSGLKAIITYGGEDGVANLRKTVLSVVAGFILIYTRSILGISIRSGSPAGPVNVIIDTVDRVVQIMALVALGVIVFAGFLMIVNVGKDEQYQRAKSLIIRVGIGVAVLLTSYGLILLIADALL